MEFAGIVSFLAMGFGLGILHAFDPDHLAAVGGMTAGNQQHQKTWLFSLHWSLGHGMALMMVALFVVVGGALVPTQLSAIAERSVGIVLIIIGGLALYRIFRSHFDNHENTSSGVLAAPVVGLLHGTAGSAPLLAVIPLAQLSQPLVGLVYVLFFSVGVLLAMTGLGSMVALGFRRLDGVNALWLTSLQVLLAMFSLLFGFYLIL